MAEERVVRTDKVIGVTDSAQTTHPSNQADAAWAKLEELRAEVIELGISLDLSWPIATLEKKIKAARGK